MEKIKEKPAHEIRIGAVRATLWKNETSKGVRYNVTFSRLYKDKQPDRWRSSDSFGRDELHLVGKVADQAETWIFQQGQNQEEDRQA